jgi:hypothetical protein
MNAGELVPYTTAEQMAAEYRDATAEIRRCAETLSAQCDRLQDAFLSRDKYDRFNFCIELCYGHDGGRTKSIDQILHKMKLAAWGAIIERLNIRRLMSSKRINELDAAIGRGYNGGRRHDDDDGLPQFPEITPENIQQVAAGMLGSATEFLEEAITEEYDYWRPSQGTKYKTNANGFWKLGRKLIKGFCVERRYGNRNGTFGAQYGAHSHLVALDNIFHMLDGKGPVTEHKGQLVGAIETSPDGRGETDYFKFKCFGNGNLHLEFKRQDLLDLFNSIAGKSDRLGQEKRRAAS